MDDVEAQIRALPSPLPDLLGIELEIITAEEVTASLIVDPSRHMQPWGAVHGGLYCTVIETLATVGAAISAIPAGRMAVGIENHTSFVRSVSEGTLQARAVALNRGRSLHLWEVRIVDEGGRLIARGTVRLMLIEMTD